LNEITNAVFIGLQNIGIPCWFLTWLCLKLGTRLSG